jgi:hypothetical protein
MPLRCDSGSGPQKPKRSKHSPRKRPEGRAPVVAASAALGPSAFIRGFDCRFQVEPRRDLARAFQAIGSTGFKRGLIGKGIDGASEGIRTLDIHLGKVTLYQTELRSLPKARTSYGIPIKMQVPFFDKFSRCKLAAGADVLTLAERRFVAGYAHIAESRLKASAP